MATYLIHAKQEQVIKTVEHGVVNCFAYSNPAWYTSKAVLGADFGKICAGDSLIICSSGKLRSVAKVTRVIEATDASIDSEFAGKPVRILQGEAVKRLGDVSVEAAAHRAKRNRIAAPPILNAKLTGFKQGAFCCALTEEQATEFRAWP